MQNSHRWGFIVVALLLSVLTTRGGLLHLTIAPLLIGLVLYEMFSVKTNRWLAVLVVVVIVLMYQFTMQILAGATPTLI